MYYNFCLYAKSLFNFNIQSYVWERCLNYYSNQYSKILVLKLTQIKQEASLNKDILILHRKYPYLLHIPYMC